MYKQAYLEGLRLFNAGQFWAAHEMFEAVWRPLPRGDPEKLFYHGLILLAAAFLHRQRASAAMDQQARAALRCFRSGLSKLESLPDLYLGLDVAALRRASHECFSPLAAGAEPSSLPPTPQLTVREVD